MFQNKVKKGINYRVISKFPSLYNGPQKKNSDSYVNYIKVIH